MANWLHGYSTLWSKNGYVFLLKDNKSYVTTKFFNFKSNTLNCVNFNIIIQLYLVYHLYNLC